MGRDTARLEALLLARRGVLYAPGKGEAAPEQVLQAFEAELAQLGFVLSNALRTALQNIDEEALERLHKWTYGTLSEFVGQAKVTEPLFRSFPHGIPRDTRELYWKKLLVYFLQAPDQPCLFCGETGTTHVLDPCCHVVCDRCFDGSSYSACPSCERHVNRDSPFFTETGTRARPREHVIFKRLILGEDLQSDARQLFEALCRRAQALSPDDTLQLRTIAEAYGNDALPWLPKRVPVKENVAIIFGALLAGSPSPTTFAQAKPHLRTATDILRALAVMSGADPGLLPEQRHSTRKPPTSATLGNQSHRRGIWVTEKARRFRMAKLPRALRREVLAHLEGFDAQQLIEDMLRHRSFWVWIGEFLHPHEYAKRFPKVALSFQVLRKRAPDGSRPPRVETWNARLEQGIDVGDASKLLDVLLERPGEFARRLDLALRTAPSAEWRAHIVDAFLARLERFATPVLLTLRSHLPLRTQSADVRVYWPKAVATTGYYAPDRRPTIPEEALSPLIQSIEAELLRRFSEEPHFDVCVIDRALSDVAAPFNERSASPSAVQLPRGSRIRTPVGKHARLFLHWCEPETNGYPTDLDLSVGFYAADWRFVGVCSYYQLTAQVGADTIAVSAGDLRHAPFPEGATEYVDVYLEAARTAGARYAVMVINAYAGMPFGRLDRAFAGVMFREDIEGEVFDPRSVELKFSLQGEHGVYLPLVLDLEEHRVHWLDIHSQGQFAMNNVATSNAAITKVCPALMTFFASGTRLNLLDLGFLHAAARCNRVLARDAGGWEQYQRQQNESALDFLERLRGAGTRITQPALGSAPLLALLYAGDFELPRDSSCYALFRSVSAVNLSASDLSS